MNNFRECLKYNILLNTKKAGTSDTKKIVKKFNKINLKHILECSTLKNNLEKVCPISEFR